MYEGIASFYDKYTLDMDREKLMKFVFGAFAKYGNEGIKKLATGEQSSESGDGTDIENSRLVIDVGCGTGKFTCLLAKKGLDMTGLDVSPEMLDVARENAEDEGVNALWLCQDMAKINTFGSYAAMLCTYDGINHLTTESRLKSFIKKSINFVDPGGLLIFDFLTPEYFRENVDGRINVDDEENGMCLWQGKFNEKTGICTYQIVCFEETEDGLYERTEDIVKEKAWTPEFIAAELKNAGYEIKKIIKGKRVYAIARKPK